MAIQSKSAYQLKFDVAICHDYLHHNMPLLSFTATRFCGGLQSLFSLPGDTLVSGRSLNYFIWHIKSEHKHTNSHWPLLSLLYECVCV